LIEASFAKNPDWEKRSDINDISEIEILEILKGLS